MKASRKAKGAMVYVVAMDGVFTAKITSVRNGGYVAQLADGTFLETCTDEAYFPEARVFTFKADAEKKARYVANI